MGKQNRKPLSFGTPKGTQGALDDLAERPDVVAKAVAEVTPPANDKDAEKKKPKRDRSKLKSMNIWVSEQGRYVVKSHANNPSTGPGKETVESFAIRAFNKLLLEEGCEVQLAFEDE